MKPRLKPIPGFPGYYVTQAGEVWSARPSRWGHVSWRLRKAHAGRDRYLDVVLRDMTRARGSVTKPVHVLTALAWLGPRPPGMCVTHLNGERIDNRVENLAYRTPRDNALDKRTHGTMVCGDNHHLAKFSDEQCRQMLADIQSGKTYVEVSQHFGVSKSTLWALKTGRIRGYLTTSIH